MRQHRRFIVRNLASEIEFINKFNEDAKGEMLGFDDWSWCRSPNSYIMLSAAIPSIQLKELNKEAQDAYNGTPLRMRFSDCKINMIITSSCNVGALLNLQNVNLIISSIKRASTDEMASKFRTFIPIDRNVGDFRFEKVFANRMSSATNDVCFSTKTNENIALFSGITISYGGMSFVAYKYLFENLNACPYLVIESRTNIPYQQHINFVPKILNMIGLFTGIYPYGTFYTFLVRKGKSENRFISYDDIMTSPACSKYRLLSLLPFEYYTSEDRCNVFNDKSGDKGLAIKKLIKPIMSSHIERLLDLFLDDEFMRMFSLFREASTTNKPLTFECRIIAYSVCLEMCSNWYQQKHNIRQRNSLLKENMRNELLEQLKSQFRAYMNAWDKRSIDLSKEDVVQIQSDFTLVGKHLENNLFTTSNFEKLSLPFRHLSIQLNKTEENALKHWRGTALHGLDIIKTKFTMDNANEYVYEAEKKCFILYRIIWKLIMKLIDYDGIYRNAPELLYKDNQHLGNGNIPLYWQ